MENINYGEKCENLLQKIAQQTALNQEFADQLHEEYMALNGNSKCYVHPLYDADKYGKKIDEAGMSLAQFLSRKASEQFAPAGTRLDIDTSQLKCWPGSRRGEGQKPFSPQALWGELESTYGNGSQQGFIAAAQKLKSILNLNPAFGLIQTSSCLKTDLDVYTDSFYKKHLNKNVFSPGCKEKIAKLIESLKWFYQWECGSVTPKYDLEHAASCLCDDITPRTAYAIGNGDLKFHVLLKKIELRFNPELGKRFMAFINTFSGLDEQ